MGTQTPFLGEASENRSGVEISRKTLAGLALIAIALVTAYRETVGGVVSHWFREGHYSHGLLILAVCVDLVYREMPRVRQLEARADRKMLLPLALLSVTSFAALISDIQIAQQLLLPLMVLTAVAVVAGRKISAQLAFPILFIYFALPVWSVLVPGLQSITVSAVSFVLWLAGIPAQVEGVHITVPSGTFQIATGCSGLGQFIVAGALAALYGFMFYSSRWRRIGLFASALLVAVAANWVRVLAIVVIGYATDMHHPIVTHHGWFGWVIFAVFMFVLFGLIYVRDGKRVSTKARPEDVSPVRRSLASRPARIFPGLLAVILLAVVPPGLYGFVDARAVQPMPVEFAVPANGPAWIGPVPHLFDWRPDFRGADLMAEAGYQSRNAIVELFLICYVEQRQGAELISEDNALSTPEGWRVVQDTTRLVPLGSGESIRVRAATLRAPDAREKLVWYFYRVAGQPTARPLVAKLLQGFGLLKLRRDAALIAAAADCRPACDTVVQDLEAFLAEMYGPITRRLDTSLAL